MFAARRAAQRGTCSPPTARPAGTSSPSSTTTTSTTASTGARPATRTAGTTSSRWRSGCLFALQGIPCLYYGTEQGLHGAGNRREAAREALWGKPGAFDPAHPFYQAVQTLVRLRQAEPALRYGRQYFRPVSGNGADFGISATPGGVLAFSRILHDRELLVAANTHTTEERALHVVVDRDLTPAGAAFEVLYANRPGPTAPGTASSRGDPRSVRVSLAPLEIQILAKRR